MNYTDEQIAEFEAQYPGWKYERDKGWKYVGPSKEGIFEGWPEAVEGEKKCTCGTDITYGKGMPSSAHSDWCEKFKL